MKTASRSILIIGLLLAVTSSSCKPDGLEKQRQEFSKKLSDAVAKKKENSETVTIRIEELTNFEWDRMYFFTPYTDIGVIYRTLNYKWEGARQTGIDTFDRNNLIVFTLNGKVVNHVLQPRHLGNMHDYLDSYPNGFTREKAIFEVKGENGDNSWLTLFPIDKSSGIESNNR